MARNEEKAQALLNKWLTMKKEMNQGPQERRPYLASECDNLRDAERWRRDILKEISKKVSEIQNAGLGEHRIRDLNDQINKLLREKGHWQRRIKELGGPDYFVSEPKFYDADGKELPGSGGYKYFGAAKDLPGVRELFQASEVEAPRRTRGDMYKSIDPDYYGYRDEDDGVLVQKEALAERRLVAEAVEEFRAKKRRLSEGRSQEVAGGAAVEEEEEDDDEEGELTRALESSAATSAAVKAHVPVPSQEDIKAVLLEKKKAALLQKVMEGGERAPS